MQFFTTLGKPRNIIILICLVAGITIVDSQFISVFYGTNLAYPGTLHILLFISLVILSAIANTLVLLFTRSNAFHEVIGGRFVYVVYLTTSAVQYSIILFLLTIITQMLTIHEYSKILMLLVTYLSHIWSAIILGLLSLRFIQWFRFNKSKSTLIYGIVFSIIIFLILISIPLLTEQFKTQ